MIFLKRRHDLGLVKQKTSDDEFYGYEAIEPCSSLEIPLMVSGLNYLAGSSMAAALLSIEHAPSLSPAFGGRGNRS